VSLQGLGGWEGEEQTPTAKKAGTGDQGAKGELVKDAQQRAAE